MAQIKQTFHCQMCGYSELANWSEEKVIDEYGNVRRHWHPTCIYCGEYMKPCAALTSALIDIARAGALSGEAI